ncbi:cell envelope integrity protein TolA [Acidicapsa dinghuensis]|uniref:Cell envelope integrity protein TolA n=1 Tax=Acidicapsa dinghuensis TaxID=2218256 RepID=A0ABW1EMH1_9BACT|nr:cell envelope integrity protein TolA [Acidicapsa dinghuensis]
MPERTPEDIQFEKSLQLLMNVQFEGMDPAEAQFMWSEAAKIEAEYKDARTKADDKALDDATRKQFKETADAIAKALPGITKGAFSAAEAFKKGDNLAGAAAIMDICASVVPIFASFAGPVGAGVGAVVGAIFSCVGQILAFFGPKQPSLGEQIQKMLETIEAEKELANLSGIHSAINIYTEELDKTREEIRAILALPLNTEADADKFRTDVKALEIGVIDQQGQLNAAAFENWKVGGWLKLTENQEKERWPEVLGAWCQEYIHLMTANTRLNCLANPKEIARLEALTSESNTASPLSKGTRKLVHTAVVEGLKPILKFLTNKFKPWNNEALRLAKETSPAAQERGLYVLMAPWASYGNVLYVASGRKNGIGWDYKKNTGWLKGFSINVPRAQLGSLTPVYEMIACEDRPTSIARYRVHSTKGDPYDGVRLMEEGHQYDNIGGGTRQFANCVDAWALPDFEDPKRTRIYTAHSTGYNYVNIHVANADNTVKRINWEPHTAAGLLHIRALVRDIRMSLPDDPDAAAMRSGLHEIIYGGYRSSRNIWVALDNSWVDVPSPWDGYNGIAVDAYCLWVFGSKGLACAPHTSVIRCKNRELPSPRWITYTTGWHDGFDVNALSPCADGTLVVCSTQQDRNTWTPNCKVNLKEQRIDLTPWERRGGWGPEIQKMPVPCWSMLQSLKTNLLKD